jgi:hypothetical protein
MKYKILKSAAHNFSHSFVSYTNYVDDGYVIDDLLQLARNAGAERIRIQWLPDSAIPTSLPPRVQKSIASNKERLAKHFMDSGVDIDRVREFRTEIFLKPNSKLPSRLI